MQQTAHAACRQAEARLKAAITLVDGRIAAIQLPSTPPTNASAGTLMELASLERNACKSASAIFAKTREVKEAVTAARIKSTEQLAEARRTADAWLHVADFLEGKGSMPLHVSEQVHTLARKVAAGIKSGALPCPSEELRRNATAGLVAIGMTESKMTFLKDTASLAVHRQCSALYVKCLANPAFPARDRKLFRSLVTKADIAGEERSRRIIATKRRAKEALSHV